MVERNMGAGTVTISATTQAPASARATVDLTSTATGMVDAQTRHGSSCGVMACSNTVWEGAGRDDPTERGNGLVAGNGSGVGGMVRTGNGFGGLAYDYPHFIDTLEAYRVGRRGSR